LEVAVFSNLKDKTTGNRGRLFDIRKNARVASACLYDIDFIYFRFIIIRTVTPGETPEGFPELHLRMKLGLLQNGRQRSFLAIQRLKAKKEKKFKTIERFTN
jgi:hypothetical protein